MRKEKMYDFQKRLLVVHEPNIRDFNYKVKEKEFIVPDNAVINLVSNSEVIETAVKDFSDFLKVSMCVSSEIVNKSSGTVNVSLAEDSQIDIGEATGYRGFMIETDENGINVYGHDERGIAQGLYYLEDLMTFSKAPIVSIGTIKKKPALSPQMVHSGYGLDDYPDEYLARVAHEGRDAILLFVKGINETTFGPLDFNELIARAARYGIDVYAYSYMRSKVSPIAPEAEKHYDSTYGKLFKECPGFKGVILVGESVAFPSSDPNVPPDLDGSTAVDGIPSVMPSSGWYPCEDYPVWLDVVKNAVRKYKPDADIVFWTYNWGYHDEKLRVKLIENLPTDISLMATFEMFEYLKIGKATGYCADYTLAFEGPGTYFKSEAIAAKKKGIRLYSMTNTAGLTWDFGVIPYEPMPHQWMRRYQAILSAKKDWDLCGVMEGHHYGLYPSFISKLSKLCFFEPAEPMDNILKKVLSSYFGEENFTKVNKALQYFSEAITYYTPGDAEQYGAFRVGPSYPFCLSDTINLPSDPKARFGSKIVIPRYLNHSNPNGGPRKSPLGFRIHEEIKSLEKMLDCMQKGMELMGKIQNPNEKLSELINQLHFMTNCVKTGLNAKKWHILISRMNYESRLEGLKKIYDDMEELLTNEIENVEDTIPLVEHDSRLGWEPTMLYMTDRWHLEWKIRQVRYVIDVDIAEYRTCLTL